MNIQHMTVRHDLVSIHKKEEEGRKKREQRAIIMMIMMILSTFFSACPKLSSSFWTVWMFPIIILSTFICVSICKYVSLCSKPRISLTYWRHFFLYYWFNAKFRACFRFWSYFKTKWIWFTKSRFKTFWNTPFLFIWRKFSFSVNFFNQIVI